MRVIFHFYQASEMQHTFIMFYPQGEAVLQFHIVALSVQESDVKCISKLSTKHIVETFSNDKIFCGFRVDNILECSITIYLQEP